MYLVFVRAFTGVLSSEYNESIVRGHSFLFHFIIFSLIFTPISTCTMPAHACIMHPLMHTCTQWHVPVLSVCTWCHLVLLSTTIQCGQLLQACLMPSAIT